MVSIAAASQSDMIAQKIMRGIESEISKKSEEIFAKHKEQMIKELADVRSEVVAQAALRIAKHSSIMYMQDKIIIEIMDRTK